MYYLVKCIHDLFPVSPKFVDQMIYIASTECAGSLEPLGLRIRTCLHPKRKCLREIPRMVSQPFLPRSSESNLHIWKPPRRFRQSEEEFPSGTAWHTNLQHPKASSRSTARRGSFLVTISCSTRPHSLGSQRVHARRQPCPQFIRKPIGEAKNRKHTGCGCEVENMPWTYKLIKLTH